MQNFNIQNFQFFNSRPSLTAVWILQRYHFLKLSINGIIIYLHLKDFDTACKVYVRWGARVAECRLLRSITGLPEFRLYGIDWASFFVGNSNTRRPIFLIMARHRRRFMQLLMNNAQHFV